MLLFCFFFQSLSSQDLLLYFYTKEPLVVCDAILLLLSLYLYRYTYFFVSPPFSFNFLCAYVQKSTSTQYYRLYNVDSYLFFTFMYELRFCKNAFTVLVCKIYV